MLQWLYGIDKQSHHKDYNACDYLSSLGSKFNRVRKSGSRLPRVHYIFPDQDNHVTIYSISQEICTRLLLCCALLWLHIWLIFPYPSGLLHWHCGNLTIAPVPAKQPWWIWINTSCEFIMNDCITTTKQSTTKPCAYFLGYTVIYNSLKSISMKVATSRGNTTYIMIKVFLIDCKLLSISSSRPGDAYMRHWTTSPLVQIMACRLFGAKPLSKPMPDYC